MQLAHVVAGRPMPARSLANPHSDPGMIKPMNFWYRSQSPKRSIQPSVGWLCLGMPKTVAAGSVGVQFGGFSSRFPCQEEGRARGRYRVVVRVQEKDRRSVVWDLQRLGAFATRINRSNKGIPLAAVMRAA